MAAAFSEKRLRHMYFPVNFAKFLRGHFLMNNCEWLLLEGVQRMTKINLTKETEEIRETNFYVYVTLVFASHISLTWQNHKKTQTRNAAHFSNRVWRNYTWLHSPFKKVKYFCFIVRDYTHSFCLRIAFFVNLEEWNVDAFKRVWYFHMINYNKRVFKSCH